MQDATEKAKGAQRFGWKLLRRQFMIDVRIATRCPDAESDLDEGTRPRRRVHCLVERTTGTRASGCTFRRPQVVEEILQRYHQ